MVSKLPSNILTRSPNCYWFANTINTVDGGTHMTGLRLAVTRVVNDYARKSGLLKDSDPNFTGDNTRERTDGDCLDQLGQDHRPWRRLRRHHRWPASVGPSPSRARATKTITILVYGDTTNETNEPVTITLDPPTGAPACAGPDPHHPQRRLTPVRATHTYDPSRGRRSLTRRSAAAGRRELAGVCLHQTVEGTLVFADVSRVHRAVRAARAAGKGRRGAPDGPARRRLRAPARRHAARPGWRPPRLRRGAALCLLFTGVDHGGRAAATAREIAAPARHRTPTQRHDRAVHPGDVDGVESGPIHLLRAGSGPFEHLALGDTVERDTRLRGGRRAG